MEPTPCPVCFDAVLARSFEIFPRRQRKPGCPIYRSHQLSLTTHASPCALPLNPRTDPTAGTMGGDGGVPGQERPGGGHRLLHHAAGDPVQRLHGPFPLRLLPHVHPHVVRDILQGLDGGFRVFVRGETCSKKRVGGGARVLLWRGGGGGCMWTLNPTWLYPGLRLPSCDNQLSPVNGLHGSIDRSIGAIWFGTKRSRLKRVSTAALRTADGRHSRKTSPVVRRPRPSR